MTDYDLLCMILSAMQWRRCNGSIRLITDRMGERYLYSCGLDILWDDGIIPSLDAVPYTVDPETFWAAGKLFALDTMSAPCVMLDTDFIVWDELSDRWDHSDLTVIHREELQPDIYPDPRTFVCAQGYCYPDNWDTTQPACNTAFCYFGSEELRRSYCEQALAFITAARGRHPLHYMVFAEQRLLSMCAAQLGCRIDTLGELPQLFEAQQTRFTHLWGYKRLLHENPEERSRFCRRCVQRIESDFPELTPILSTHPLLRPYQIK